MLTLPEAARLAGVSKTTLMRAIRAGRLAATPLDGGGYLIDARQFARVYNVKIKTSETVDGARVERPQDGVPETRSNWPTAPDLPELAEPPAAIDPPAALPDLGDLELTAEASFFDATLADPPTALLEAPAALVDPPAADGDPNLEARIAALADEVRSLRESLPQLMGLDAEVKALRSMLDEARSSRDDWRGRAERLQADQRRAWWRQLTG